MNDPDPIPPGFDLTDWQSKPYLPEPDTAAAWAMRCKSGVLHAEHGEVLTAEDVLDTLGAAEFMDEPRDPPGNPWPCGPHETVPAPSGDLCRHCGQGPDGDGDHSCPCPYRDEECPDHG